MTRLLARRLVQLVPTFVGVTIVTFVLLRLAPGEAGALQSDGLHDASAQSLEAWRHLRGFDAPLWQQYASWLGRVLTLDFGRSLVDEQPVTRLIAAALPRPLVLAGGALVLTYMVAVPLGVHGAMRRGSRLEGGVSTLLFVLYSLPPFWVALVLILLFAGGELVPLFPLRGLTSPGVAEAGVLVRLVDLAWHLVLPVACLSYPAMARTARLMRVSLLESVGADYVRTARAKGLPEWRVITHALRNALVPMAALLSIDLPWLVGGSVVIERIFTIRGMGMLTFEAVLRRDYPVILGVTALAALITMAAMLAGDLLHLALDPRARRGLS